MGWQSLRREELHALIDRDLPKMRPEQRRLWEAIAVEPEKWRQDPYGEAGGGFWVVALIGREVIWYNDIEDGFNASRYVQHGIIEDYWCNQDELQWVVNDILCRLNGKESRAKLGPPRDLKS
jgi:hypothetical protein